MLQPAAKFTKHHHCIFTNPDSHDRLFSLHRINPPSVTSLHNTFETPASSHFLHYHEYRLPPDHQTSSIRPNAHISLHTPHVPSRTPHHTFDRLLSSHHSTTASTPSCPSPISPHTSLGTAHVYTVAHLTQRTLAYRKYIQDHSFCPTLSHARSDLTITTLLGTSLYTLTYHYLTISTQPYLITDHSSIAALPLVSKYLSYLSAFFPRRDPIHSQRLSPLLTIRFEPLECHVSSPSHSRILLLSLSPLTSRKHDIFSTFHDIFHHITSCSLHKSLRLHSQQIIVHPSSSPYLVTRLDHLFTNTSTASHTSP